jgi:DNA polymerase III alpha subunit (gram-positive type)
MNKYIAIDTETGGIDKYTSLLTAYFAVLNENFEIVSELDLVVKPEDGNYVVTARALEINRINLVTHDANPNAVNEKVAGGKLREFLIAATANGKTKLVPLGQNVAFDLAKIYEDLLNKTEAEKYISYRVLDTGTIGQFLKVLNKIPETVSGSLGSWVEHFKVKQREAHTARGDVEMTVDVLKAMIELANSWSEVNVYSDK